MAAPTLTLFLRGLFFSGTRAFASVSSTSISGASKSGAVQIWPRYRPSGLFQWVLGRRGRAADSRPAFDDPLITGFPIGAVGSERQAWFNINDQLRVVIETERHAVQVAFPGQVSVHHGLPAHLWKGNGAEWAIEFGRFSAVSLGLVQCGLPDFFLRMLALIIHYGIIHFGE